MSTSRIAICTFASVLLAVIPSAAFAWTIESFDATVDVFEDATIMVEETIHVDFDVDKHGIYRTIPVTYRDQLNNRVRVHLDVLSVTQDGESATYVDYKSGTNRVIKIGDADRTVTGSHTYTVQYRVDRALLYFEDYDELYWNVTGTAWEVPIFSASALVTLPDGTTIQQVDCYTGPLGSTNQSCGSATDGNMAAFVAEDFLTIAVGFDKGVVYEPTLQDRLFLFVADNWAVVIPFFLMIGVIALWWRHGRDPKMATVIAEFKPPNDMWAAYVGIIARGMFVSADIAGMIVQMAVKGYLSFHVEGKGLKRTVTLKKEKKHDGLDEAHRELFDHLFTGRDEVLVRDLKKSASTQTMKRIRKALDDELKEQNIYVKHSRRRRNVIVFFAVFLFYLAFALGSALGAVTGFAFGVAAIVIFGFGLLMPKKTEHGTEVARHVAGFRLFMHTAERYRSQWQEKEHIFEEFLPYAIVFGHTKQWAKTFEGIGFHQPDWYKSSAGFVAADVFTKDLLNVAHSVSRSAVPTSSGSSGSGSSGGGFGGGGGGSW